MAGDPQKASLWADADVYVAPVGTALPSNADDDWGPGWGLVGLLDGSDGFVHNRSQESSDHYAWGQILVRSPKRNFKLEVQFSALEDNDVTRDLVWPGSTATVLKVPVPQPILLGLELREGLRTKRVITALHAECATDSYTENESDLTKYPITATIFPTADRDLWIVQDTGARTVSGLTVAGSGPTSVGQITKLTATAAVVPSGSLDVTRSATWSTSDAGVATVVGGFVEAVDDGTAVITASYGGQSDTVNVTVGS